MDLVDHSDSELDEDYDPTTDATCRDNTSDDETKQHQQQQSRTKKAAKPKGKAKAFRRVGGPLLNSRSRKKRRTAHGIAIIADDDEDDQHMHDMAKMNGQAVQEQPVQTPVVESPDDESISTRASAEADALWRQLSGGASSSSSSSPPSNSSSSTTLSSSSSSSSSKQEALSTDQVWRQMTQVRANKKKATAKKSRAQKQLKKTNSWWQQPKVKPTRSSSESSNIHVGSSLDVQSGSSDVIVKERRQFAGKEVVVERRVAADSTQARKYLQKTESARELDLLLDDLATRKHLTTMDKSKSDWDRDKTSEGDAEDLSKFAKSKEGFVDQAEFLRTASQHETSLLKATAKAAGGRRR